jgi:hypothetical protein
MYPSIAPAVANNPVFCVRFLIDAPSSHRHDVIRLKRIR